MKSPVPRSKLGKRERRALDSRNRLMWEISPVTRRNESKKTYTRKQKHRNRIADPGTALLFLFRLQLRTDTSRPIRRGDSFPGRYLLR